MEKEVLISIKKLFIKKLNVVNQQLFDTHLFELKVRKAQLEGFIEGLEFEINQL